jgi:hypothetical protein
MAAMQNVPVHCFSMCADAGRRLGRVTLSAVIALIYFMGWTAKGKISVVLSRLKHINQYK